MRSSPRARPVREAGRTPDPGAVVRSARIAQGLSLAGLGNRVGYSASQVSRYERGIAPLTDITLLRLFADALGIPPHHFGLSTGAPATARHAASRQHSPDGTGGHNVVRERQWEDGDDPVRRREMLLSAITLTGAAALGQAASRPAAQRTQVTALEQVLYGSADGAPGPLASLRAAVTGARADFHAARYGKVQAALPGLIAAARASSEDAGSGEQAAARGMLAEAYIVAADFAVKINDDPLSWMTADRALQAAQAGNDPLIFADARRALATAMRRAGHPDRACDLLIRACHDIEPAGSASPDQIATYGSLLNVAAYTAATAGNRRAAQDYITEAASAAGRLANTASSRQPAFGPAGVTLFQLSIAQVLGDSGTAIDHARTLRPAEIPTAERRGRYWVDVARAYHQWDKPESCYSALLAAERCAPAEVRYRPPVHRMTEDLLRSPRSSAMPGLLAFARRTGLPGA
jgi:transcriptional regulator with XRE-family HTH domain